MKGFERYTLTLKHELVDEENDCTIKLDDPIAVQYICMASDCTFKSNAIVVNEMMEGMKHFLLEKVSNT